MMFATLCKLPKVWQSMKQPHSPWNPTTPKRLTLSICCIHNDHVPIDVYLHSVYIETALARYIEEFSGIRLQQLPAEKPHFNLYTTMLDHLQ